MISHSRDVFDGIILRPAHQCDVEAVFQAHLRNREHLRPFVPQRDEAFFTLEGQRGRLRDQLSQMNAGLIMPWLLVDGDRVVGTVTLSNIALGPFRNAKLGYWIDVDYVGRGLATAAVELACQMAVDELDLHRVEAGTLIENAASQKVLYKCGFEVIGTAACYLEIDGKWQDHRLYQRILY